MGDAYVRTGRGGAGNFHTQKDIDDVATKARAEDIEAQKPTAPNPSPPAGPSVFVRSGRGGAGNFVLSSSSGLPTTSPNPDPSIPTPDPTSTSIPTPVPVSVPVSVSTQPAPTRSKYSGRGGAGNWADDESAETKRAKLEQDKRRKEALDAGIAQEIRASLPQPPRTYHLHAPGRGRRPDNDVVDS
ncbi:hypothetical protein F4861DRAFT_397380 [Xylaria intraflava]|nr:hypothetical protein F4861DRAFT_397380 [Xylaria intraflava]